MKEKISLYSISINEVYIDNSGGVISADYSHKTDCVDVWSESLKEVLKTYKNTVPKISSSVDGVNISLLRCDVDKDTYLSFKDISNSLPTLLKKKPKTILYSNNFYNTFVPTSKRIKNELRYLSL